MNLAIGQPLPRNEALRQRSVDELNFRIGQTDLGLHRLAELAAITTGATMAGLTVIDGDQQLFAATCGLLPVVGPRADSFCQHTILGDGPMEIVDAKNDPRFIENPFVIGPSRLRSYAGVPVHAPSGFKIGALCVLDTRPRQLSSMERACLIQLAGLAENELLLRSLSLRNRETGLYRLESFLPIADRICRESWRAKLPVGVICAEVFGAAALDVSAPQSWRSEVLGRLGERLLRCCSPSDVLITQGPENRFTILVVNEELPRLMALCASICLELSALGPSPETARVHINLGHTLSRSCPAHNQGICLLIARAHEAMRQSGGLSFDH